jgi:CheY-like chemotaxis protein
VSVPPSQALHGTRVLVVDDDEVILQVMAALLAGAGAQVRAVVSGREALDAIDAEVPDVLVSDLYMPGLDGFTLMRKIRERPADKGRDLPAVAVTAQPSFETRRDALQAGYQDVLPKPFGSEHLIRIVLALASGPEPAA